MKIFNVDLHISVINDVKYNLLQLDENLIIDDSRSWSGHCHLVNKKNWDSKYINANNWKTALMDESIIESFVRKYYSILSSYDAFIVTHTPFLIALFVTFCKPILVVNSCRFDQPFCWKSNASDIIDGRLRFAEMVNRSCEYIRMCSNNLGDCDYLNHITKIKTLVIPSLCDYHETVWRRGKKTMQFATYGRGPRVKLAPSIPKSYSFDDLANMTAIVVFPYETSTMTFFELCSMCIPLYIPSKQFFIELSQSNLVELQSDYTIPEFSMGCDFWLDRAEYWHVDAPFMMFDSLDELNKLLSTTEQTVYTKVHIQMKQLHLQKKKTVMKYWKDSLNWLTTMSNTSDSTKFQNIFTDIYKHKKWGTGSGDGSKFDVVKPFNSFLKKLILSLNIRSICDIGCGYGDNMAILVDSITTNVTLSSSSSPFTYIGYDVVKHVIDSNRENFPGMNWKEYDCVNNNMLKSFDLIVVKDVVQHLPNILVASFLTRIIKSCKYLVVVTDISGNSDNNSDKYYEESVDIPVIGDDRIFNNIDVWPLSVLPFCDIFRFGKCKHVLLCSNI